MIFAAVLSLALAQAEPDGGMAVPEVVDAGVPPAALPFEPPPAVQPAAPKAHWALWGQPLGLAGYAAAGTLVSTGSASTPVLAYVPLGANLVLASVELVFELTVTGQVPGSFQPASVGVLFSAGPLWHTGSIPLNGLFVQPKLIGTFATTLGLNPACGAFCPQTDNAAIALGVDVGYQFTFRKMYFAFVLGFGAGGGTYAPLSFVGPFQSVFSGGFPGGLAPSQVSPVLLMNLNLLRAGTWN